MVDQLTGLWAWLEGKKTYLTAIVAGVLAALGVLGIEVPEYVLTALMAFGLYSVRSAIAKAGG